MKKLRILMIMFVLVFSIAGCGQKKQDNEYDSKIETAIDVIKETWLDNYDGLDVEPYLEIKNTRIICIKDDATDGFEEYDYIVEFILFSDYLGSAPYYGNAEAYDSVVVYKDGHAEVQLANPLKLFRARMYKTDFSDIIETVADLGSEYNQVLELK